MKKLKEEKAKAELAELRAEMAEIRAKRSETSEHNTDQKMSKHPIIEQRPKQNRTFTS